jgi:hypothetical protein
MLRFFRSFLMLLTMWHLMGTFYRFTGSRASRPIVVLIHFPNIFFLTRRCPFLCRMLLLVCGAKRV